MFVWIGVVLLETGKATLGLALGRRDVVPGAFGSTQVGHKLADRSDQCLHNLQSNWMDSCIIKKN